jgi:hypothetical protein
MNRFSVPENKQTGRFIPVMVCSKVILQIPASGDFEGKPVLLHLYDMRGNLIGSFPSTIHRNSPVKIGNNGSKLAMGNYVLQLKLGRKKTMQQFQIVE